MKLPPHAQHTGRRGWLPGAGSRAQGGRGPAGRQTSSAAQEGSAIGLEDAGCYPGADADPLNRTPCPSLSRECPVDWDWLDATNVSRGGGPVPSRGVELIVRWSTMPAVSEAGARRSDTVCRLGCVILTTGTGICGGRFLRGGFSRPPGCRDYGECPRHGTGQEMFIPAEHRRRTRSNSTTASRSGLWRRGAMGFRSYANWLISRAAQLSELSSGPIGRTEDHRLGRDRRLTQEVEGLAAGWRRRWVDEPTTIFRAGMRRALPSRTRTKSSTT